MIDLHCHILPGIDDGAVDYATAIKMASASVDSGVSILACTPHILPGLYHNTGSQIRQATLELQQVLAREGIPLKLVTGADNHITPDFKDGLNSGRLLTLADTRYVLVEPPHHVAPPRLESFFFDLLAAGYIPILTHPERLTWMRAHYDAIQRLAESGVWMQLTAGSLSGAFGRRAMWWAERMLDDRIVHILATDAHDMDRRRPDLEAGREYAEKRVGTIEAQHMVITRPDGILQDRPPRSLPLPEAAVPQSKTENESKIDRVTAETVSVDTRIERRSFAARLFDKFN